MDHDVLVEQGYLYLCVGCAIACTDDDRCENCGDTYFTKFVIAPTDES